jgi:hypothetical protein
MGLVAIAMMAGATGTTTVRVTGIGIGIGIGTAIVEAGGTAAADSIAPTLRDLRRLTDAKTATPCKTVFANHTGATKGIIVRAISPPLAIRPSDAALGSRTFHAGYPRFANQCLRLGRLGAIGDGFYRLSSSRYVCARLQAQLEDQQRLDDD